MSLMYYLEDDMCPCVHVDNYSAFYILKPPPDVSDVDFLQDDVRSMADNLSEIIKLCRVENEAQVTRATQAEEDALEMQVIVVSCSLSFLLICTYFFS
jgi:hypothetical protein